MQQKIVGGHVSLWTPGLLLYHLVLAGFDCSEARIKCYDYDISIILKKKSITLPDIQYDAGDLKKLKEYFPNKLKFYDTGVDTPFNGNMKEINWS